MDVQAIRDLIAQAKAIESHNKHLRKQIYDQIELLHDTIELPEDNAFQAVFNFVVEYIDHVPVFIDVLYQASAKADISSFIYPFLDIAEENFLASATHEDGLVGLDVLLDKAYFTHRLLEELNDKYLLHTGSALIPMNMTWSNLIVHAILGEPFANDIDRIIEQTVEQMMRSQAIYNKEMYDGFVNMRNPEEWINLWSQWDTLSKKLDIELNFTAQQAG